VIENETTANLEYYKVFYYVALNKSITEAANRLSLTQPSVSKSIQKLEEQLNCKLFTRTKRGVVLTTEGEALWNRIEPAYELIQSAERELSAIESLESGTLSIAATEMGFGIYVLPAITKFLKDYPNIKVEFKNAQLERTPQMLSSGAVDLAILYSPFKADEFLSARTIGTFQECLIAGSQYAELAKKQNNLKDLAKYPFISLPEGSSVKVFMTAWFKEYDLIYDPEIEVTTMELVIQAATSNLGIGTLPNKIVDTRIAEGTLYQLPIKNELPIREVYAVTDRHFQSSLAARTFIENYL
jgi:DNA-binding transcriptional LysR family regulator